MTRPSIDLNADLGEGMPWDFELLALISSANVSCGAHAGDEEDILATLCEARRRKVVVGAHPGWADRPNFGRIDRSASRIEVETLVVEQVGVLERLAAPLGLKIAYVKPHGALYNQAMRDDPEIAAGLLDACRRLRLPLMGQPGMPIEARAHTLGITYLREGFPDRAYREDGRLVPRSESGALLEGVDAVVRQALALFAAGVDSLCLHGDSPEAVARAEAIRRTFEREGIALQSAIGRPR